MSSAGIHETTAGIEVSDEQSRRKPRRLSTSSLAEEAFLGLFVLLLTVLTALASYEAASSDYRSSDDTLAGQNYFAEASAYRLAGM